MNEGNRLGFEVECFQSNIESEIFTRIHYHLKDNRQELIIDPTAFLHTNIVIQNTLVMIDIPNAEIHLSNIYRREDFR
jgi:3-dehydroquinate dehydratase-2